MKDTHTKTSAHCDVFPDPSVKHNEKVVEESEGGSADYWSGLKVKTGFSGGTWSSCSTAVWFCNVVLMKASLVERLINYKIYFLFQHNILQAEGM